MMFGPRRSVPLLECGGPHGGFDAASSLEYTTILSSLPFLLPPSQPVCLPPSLVFLPLSPLPRRPSSLPLHFPWPVCFINPHIAAVGRSLPNRIVVLIPIICVLSRMRWMAGGGDLGWPRNAQ